MQPVVIPAFAQWSGIRHAHHACNPRARLEGIGDPGLKFSALPTEEHNDEFRISRVSLYGNATRYWFNPHDS